jgi:tetratricopeptide (TPR) repeat protein
LPGVTPPFSKQIAVFLLARQMHRPKLLPILAAALFALHLSAQQPDPAGSSYRKAAVAFARGEFSSAASSFQEAFAVNRKDDAAAYMTAVSHARAGNETLAILWLKKLIQLGSCLKPRSDAFAGMQKDEDFRKVSIELEKCAACRSRSEVAFTIPRADLVVRSIAYDPPARAFYIGSTRKRRSSGSPISISRSRASNGLPARKAIRSSA